MLTSGKFNSYFPLLGFDAVKNERGEYTGIYKPNKKELKQVEWIMSSFLRVDRYKVLLDLCESRGIKSKQGKYFSRSNIRSLLTNPRYIGKWYRNKHNADKRQNKLMPYERFTEVELGHGCVIDKGLWQKVQDKVKELDKSRAQLHTALCRFLAPSTATLYLACGHKLANMKRAIQRAFTSEARGNTQKSTYYHNKVHKLRVRSEVFEAEAEKILRQVVENAPEFQKSIADYSARKESSIGILARKIAEIDTRLDKVMAERQSLDKRLSFLLNDDDMAMAQSFRSQYKKQCAALNDEEQELESKKSRLQELQRQVAVAQIPSKNGWLEQVNKALGYIRKKDLVSLRSTYRQIFEKVVVRRLDEAKVRLQFVFKNLSTPLGNGEVGFCVSVGRVVCGRQDAESILNQALSMESDSYITPSFIHEGVLRQKYLVDRLSIRDIAREFACSKTRVRDILLNYNIPLRRRSQPPQDRWTTYGKRRLKGKVIDHKAELRAVATIKQMYAEGNNTSAIARILNTMKIPTKHQGKGWQQNTVAKILKREGVYVEGGGNGRGRAISLA